MALSRYQLHNFEHNTISIRLVFFLFVTDKHDYKIQVKIKSTFNEYIAIFKFVNISQF